MATKKDEAEAFANELMGLAGTLQAVRAQCASLNSRWNDEQYSAILAAMATAPLNTDGSLGTADATPTAGHPIDNRVAGQTTLNKAVTAAQLTAGMTMVVQLINFFGNVAVTTGNYSQTIDDLN